MSDEGESPRTDPDLELVYLAASVDEAEKIVAVLDREGVEFVTSLEEYMPGGGILGALTSKPLVGIGFFVLPGQAVYVRERLATEGLGAGVIAEV